MIYAALRAGKLIMSYYNEDVDIRIKADKTPVTDADIGASDIIISTLKKYFSDAAILCEETADECDENGVPTRLTADRVFIVDPLDGTRAFLNKTGQFAVSISYAEFHEGIAAVIYAPAYGKLYYAAKGHGAWRTSDVSGGHVPFTGERISASKRTDNLRVLIGNGKNDPYALSLIEYNSLRIAEVISVSSCIKGCMIAEGTADVHYKFADYTKEWDTSAEELICREAGALVTDAYGGELISNRADVRNMKGIRILNRIESALNLP